MQTFQRPRNMPDILLSELNLIYKHNFEIDTKKERRKSDEHNADKIFKINPRLRSKKQRRQWQF